MSDKEEKYTRLDQAFARFLSQRSKFENVKLKSLEYLLARLSQQQHQGHNCIEISETEKELILNSGLATDSTATFPLTFPLIIEQNRLYLHRYWFYEDRLAQQIERLSHISFTAEKVDNLLDRYFGIPGPETNLQRAAAQLACELAFCVITGGPGTGKTTTVCKILATVQELSPKPLLIALAAPTGKAAMRLQEAIVQNLTTLDCPDAIKAHIPKTATTLHRLLGANPPSPYFRHDAGNPLIYDLVVVDEASMVDLSLMSKLVDALKPGARLILIGDKDQLVSVESGAVLADLIAALPDITVELKQSYRFNDTIKKLADSVNQQNSEEAWTIMSEAAPTIRMLAQKQLIPYILDQRTDYVRLIKSNADFPEIYRAFNRFQVLCSNRHGNVGAFAINATVEQELFGQHQKLGATSWYTGRPVMVKQNSPTLHLYNGDIGICLPDQEQSGNLMVFFHRPDGTIKKYLPTRMPNCETNFAITIHKSQGSEFEQVLVALPETINPVLSKELLYTAITRARKKLTLVVEKDIFIATIRQKITRTTGLPYKLQKSKCQNIKKNLSV